MPIIAPGPLNAASTSQTRPAAAPADANARKESGVDGSFSFGDLLDIINPLQHIPVVGALYREITGDTIGATAKIAGGTLFGGVLGLVASLVDTVITEATGKDSGQHLVAILRSGESDFGPEGTGGTDVALLDNAAPTDGENSRADGEQVAAASGEDIWLDDATDTRALGNLYQSHNATSPQPLQTSVPLSGVRGVAFAGLPSPQTVAANPGLIAAARSTTKAAAGSNAIEAGSAGWIKLMQAAEGSRSTATGGLASATIAKAMASYGALGGSKNPMATLAGASRH